MKSTLNTFGARLAALAVCIITHSSFASEDRIITNDPKTNPLFTDATGMYWRCEGHVNQAIIRQAHQWLEIMSKSERERSPIIGTCLVKKEKDLSTGRFDIYRLEFYVDQNGADCIRRNACPNIRNATPYLIEGHLAYDLLFYTDETKKLRQWCIESHTKTIYRDSCRSSSYKEKKWLSLTN